MSEPLTRNVKAKLLSSATAAGLETAINAWFTGSAEQTFLGLQVEALGTDLVATITYCD